MGAAEPGGRRTSVQRMVTLGSATRSSMLSVSGLSTRPPAAQDAAPEAQRKEGMQQLTGCRA